MCGIAGVAGLACSEETKRKITESMHRRGPDDSGLWEQGDITLFHDRLAVIDVKNGTQPMLWREGERTCVLVYNGELYNTNALRRELQMKQHRFRTRSDTEVLLHSYLEWGEDCVQRCNGIFAFALWDSACEAIFFARDRIGVKPLFYAQPNGQFAFSSEIKTLLCLPELRPEIGAQAIFELMLIGPGRTPGYGVFKGIREVPPAHCGWYDRRRGLTLKRYWDLEDRPHTDDLPTTIETVRELVRDAIRRQLVSDVPLCTFLSGGLDSSIISAVAAREYRMQGRQLDTVSVTYKNNKEYFKATHFQPNTDDDYIARMNDAIGANNHLITIDTPQLVEALYDAVLARDLPGMVDVDSSLLLFCREIKQLGTVALSGECADEIFGGYPWYRDPDVRRRQGFPWAQSTAYRAEFLRDEWKRCTDPLAYVDEKYQRTIAQVRGIEGDSADDRRIREMTRLNFSWFMQTLLDGSVIET